MRLRIGSLFSGYGGLDLAAADIGISRADQLKAVGNGVCTQQAYAAGTQLLDMTINQKDTP